MAPINDTPEFSQEEIGLALHNPGTQLEATAGHRGATSGTPAPASTTCVPGRRTHPERPSRLKVEKSGTRVDAGSTSSSEFSYKSAR
jgi:hypothetical protein